MMRRSASLEQQHQHQEDPVTFGNRLRFIDLHCGTSIMPWPCLHFTHVQELLAVLRSRGMISCPHMIRRVNVEYLKHLQQLRRRRRRPDDKDDPVVFLFGSKTPGGSRLIFPSEHDNVQDYKESITRAVDIMQSEPCFMDALNDTSPILGNLLAEEMQAPGRLPDAANGEHAPAA